MVDCGLATPAATLEPNVILGRELNLKLSEIQTRLEQIADAIATSPPEQWPGWVVYLLEALDGKADKQAYRAALEAIRDNITTRLDEGRW